MSYTIQIKRSAQKSLAQITEPYQAKIISAIQQLAYNPRPSGCKRLSGKEAWRIRVGDYRILYEIKDRQLLILIVVIGHRREVYADLT